MTDKKQLTATVSAEYHDQLEDEADEVGLSRAEYVRQRLQAGRLVVDAGRVNLQTLEQMVDAGIESTEIGDDNISQIDDDDLASTVLDILPADESSAMSKDELRELVYGTQKEQEENIDNVTESLYKTDKIDSAYGGGYYVK